ncbi:MATE family efflux transporter [Xenorhabdus doucetiae]|uniref:MATE family multidrug resistance protein n=1 Tax=Xenorhabdus doucetiae TaxID=351671 RepID=A0A068QPC5_9GAMM|nr:MATE family efflux transporter [Xenorhabdus doucetiae]TYP08830.1 MATE family multidrug resistance protein [Xenorhabdus doucetiae]CDG16644.1 putative multidrug efflux protein, MatE family [Xenorhabdus doucetiae]
MQTKNNFFYFKEIVKLATPILSVRILYIAVGFIGMLFIAHLGKQELAASALVAALSNTIMVVAMSPLLAVGITVSRYYGQNELREIGMEIRQAWLISIILGVIGSLVFWNLTKLLVWLHQPIELVPLIDPYFRAMAWGVIPSLLLASCHQMFFPLKKGYLVVVLSALNLGFTILLGYALIHGYAGLPTLGMAGWAYSISIANWTLAISVFIYLYFSKNFTNYHLFDFKVLWDPARLVAFFQISFPITIQFASELLIFSTINIMVGWLGVGALSVQQILIQCSTVALMIPMGIGQACTILVSYTVGNGEYNLIRKIGHVGLVLVFGCMIAIAVVYLLNPLAIIGLYLNLGAEENAALIELAKVMLVIVAFSQIADAVRNLLMAVLRGLRDVWYPMWVNMGLLWIFGLPVSYLLAFPLKQGQQGINIGFLITFLLGAILMMVRFFRKTADMAHGKTSGKSINN